MIRRGIVIVAILAALLNTHMVGLAGERMSTADEPDPIVIVLPGSENTIQDLAVVGDEPVAAKPGVSVWGKCQVPGKCEVGVSIKIRF
jgi:hypothetical protein